MRRSSSSWVRRSFAPRASRFGFIRFDGRTRCIACGGMFLPFQRFQNVHRQDQMVQSTVVNHSRFQKAEESRRQAMAVALEAKERENAALQERAASFAKETRKIENLRALRLARDAAAKVGMRRQSETAPPTRAA